MSSGVTTNSTPTSVVEAEGLDSLKQKLAGMLRAAREERAMQLDEERQRREQYSNAQAEAKRQAEEFAQAVRDLTNIDAKATPFADMTAYRVTLGGDECSYKGGAYADFKIRGSGPYDVVVMGREEEGDFQGIETALAVAASIAVQ